jgi:hypothetical protein
LPEKPPTASAAEIASRTLAAMTTSKTPTVEDYIKFIRTFEKVEFEVSNGPCNDGFAFEYNPMSVREKQVLRINCTRQFIVLDSDDIMHFTQIALVYEYDMDPRWQDIEGRVDWWYRGANRPFEEWLKEVQSSPVWRTVSAASALSFSIESEEFC